jgi:hypothetical protein
VLTSIQSFRHLRKEQEIHPTGSTSDDEARASLRLIVRRMLSPLTRKACRGHDLGWIEGKSVVLPLIVTPARAQHATIPAISAKLVLAPRRGILILLRLFVAIPHPIGERLMALTLRFRAHRGVGRRLR